MCGTGRELTVCWTYFVCILCLAAKLNLIIMSNHQTNLNINLQHACAVTVTLLDLCVRGCLSDAVFLRHSKLICLKVGTDSFGTTKSRLLIKDGFSKVMALLAYCESHKA